MFYEKFLELCVSVGKSPSTAAQEAGFSNAAATDWKNGSKPRKANLLKLANYFNVPVEYFFEETEKDPSQMAEVSPVKKNLLKAVDGMTDAECKNLLALIEAAKRI